MDAQAPWEGLPLTALGVGCTAAAVAHAADGLDGGRSWHCAFEDEPGFTGVELLQLFAALGALPCSPPGTRAAPATALRALEHLYRVVRQTLSATVHPDDAGLLEPALCNQGCFAVLHFMITPTAGRVHPTVTPDEADAVQRGLMALRGCRGPDAVAELRRGALLLQPAQPVLRR
eukprot:5992128-Lingulodinium_polyedra.AAC.1